MTRGRKKGHPKTGGRKAGVNGAEKLRKAIVTAFEELGGVKYLVEVAKINPSVFCSLLGKLLPPEQPAPASGNNVLVLRWVTPEIAQARGMIETTANNKEPGQD